MKRILFALLSMAALSANAATLYLTEFVGAPPNSVYYQAAKTPFAASQTVAVGVSSAQSSAFGSTTGLIRVHCDVVCNVSIGGTNPTATTSLMRMAAGATEYFVVKPGDKLAVIAGT